MPSFIWMDQRSSNRGKDAGGECQDMEEQHGEPLCHISRRPASLNEALGSQPSNNTTITRQQISGS